MGKHRHKYTMGYFNILLIVAPVLAQLPTTTFKPSNNETSQPNFNATSTPVFNTTSMPIFNTTSMPIFNTTSMPNINITSMSTATTMRSESTTTMEEVCTGHVCLSEENGFFAEGCCENSYCQCYGGVGYLKHCDGEGVFNEDLQACDWDWHVPCCNATMPTLPTPEERCQAIQCHEDGYFPEGKCEDIFCQCIGGVGHVQHCHDGLFFNPAISVCDWPWNNPGCSGDATDPTPANNQTTTTAYHTTTTTLPPEEQCSYNCDEAENGVYAEGCCESTYCQCFAGEGYLHYCPPNSVFNSELGFCDSIESVECCGYNSTTTFPTIMPVTTTTGSTTNSNTTGTTNPMPSTTTGMPNTTTKSPGTTTPPSSCSYDCTGHPDGHYAEGECSPMFCDCVEGEGTIKYCQAGTVFNDILGYCTNPENTVGC